MPQSYDVIVLGLGGMGSAALWHLAARGVRVLGLERFTPPHDHGSSHGQSRIIRQAYYEDPAYVPLLFRAYELWDDLERATGRRLLLPTGGVFIGPPDADLIAGSLRSAREHSLPHQVLSAAEIRQRWPVLHADPSEIGVFEDRSGVLLVEECVRAHVDAALRRGAEAHFEEPVLRWSARPGGDGVVVETKQGRYEAARLVIAGGAWNPGLLGDLGLPFRVERQVLYWFDPGPQRALFALGRLPIWAWEHPDITFFYGFPDLGAPGVKAAFHHGGETTSADQIRRTVSAEETAAFRAVLRRFVPALDVPPTQAATCMYTNTPDDHFVIGLHPQYPQVALAAGFSGHGFKFCAVVGEVLADLARSGSTRHPIGLFAPTRFQGQH